MIGRAPDKPEEPLRAGYAPKTVVISGGTAGMGRAVALERLARGDHVTVIGSSEARGRALLDRTADPNLRFLRADLSSIAEVTRRTGAGPAVPAELAGLILHSLTNGLVNEHLADPEAVTADVIRRAFTAVLTALLPPTTHA